MQGFGSGELLLGIAGSRSSGTHGHILLFHESESHAVTPPFLFGGRGVGKPLSSSGIGQ